jgi:hypothetical protein
LLACGRLSISSPKSLLPSPSPHPQHKISVHHSQGLVKSQPFFIRVIKTGPRENELLVRSDYKENI